MSQHLKWRTVLIGLAFAAGALLALRFVLPAAWPFLVGLAAALGAERAVLFLRDKTGMPRALASFLCMLALFSLVGAAVYVLCRLVLGELVRLVRELPALAAAAAGPLQALRARLFAMADSLPDGLGTGARAGLERFFSGGAGLGARVYDRLFSFASGLLERLPNTVVCTVTAILSGFMLSAELPQLRRSAARALPPEWRIRLASAAVHVRATLGGWLRAECRLMAIIFAVINVGLLLLGVRFPVLEAAAITLVDALPVFGSGTVLLPWAVVCFLRGSTRFGVGLVILYAAAALTRQCLEPRLVGRQVGLSPVWTLAALYTGYRILGVAGMIVFPMSAMLGKRLWDHSGLQKA